jgi:uncharacterized protein YceH (UPF0502 family)
MSAETQPGQTGQTSESAPWPALQPIERRILGALIEKGKTTPDAYPLTLNALITACNQKNNRDPVMNLTEAEVEEALPRLKQLGYLQQILGSGRTDKFRHVLYEAWRVDKVQLAVLGELLLRGGQTEGELRGRASRMEPIADLEMLRQVLKTLAARGLVVYLTPEGRRGTMLTHGFHSELEFRAIRSRAVMEDPETSQGQPPAGGWEPRLAALEEAVTTLQKELADLKRQLGL